MSKNELAIIPAGEHILPDAETMDMVMQQIQEINGNGTIPYGRAKIASSTSDRFLVHEVGDPENQNDDPKEIKGVIIASQNRNAFWKNAIGTGEAKAPDCASKDGVTGVDSDGVVHKCAACPMNAFGSSVNGNGKACKNQIYLFILRQGEPFPLLFTVPPTSMKPFKDYRIKLLRLNVPLYGVLSTMTLTFKQGNGKTYPVLTFGDPVKLCDEEISRMHTYMDFFKRQAASMDTVTEDAQSETASAPDGGSFIQVEPDEQLPF